MSRLDLEDRLLLPVVLLLPWAFGGVETWAYRVAALAIVAAVGVVLWKHGPAGLGIGLPRERWQIAAFALALWAGAQLLPLPPSAVRLLSPHARAVYEETFPGYPVDAPRRMLASLEREAVERSELAPAGPATTDVEQDVDCGTTWRTLSLSPGATKESLLWYLALLGAFLVVRSRAAHPATARVYRWSLFAGFSCLAGFGLIQHFGWNGRMYWIRPLLVEGRPFGPYVDPSHFAGAMELAVPWMAGYVWSRLARLQGRWGDYPARVPWAAAGCVLCLAAGLATASKVAVVLLPAGLLALVLFGARTARMRARLVVGVLLVGAIVATLLAGTNVGERVRSHLDRVEGIDVAGGRVGAWSAAARMVADYPLTGVGFGAFADVFPRYIAPGEFKQWPQLHNDYYEVVVTGGLGAAVLLLALVWGYASGLGKSLFAAPQVSRTRLGLAIGIASLALHAFVDFNHQIPANALLFVTLAALALPLREPPVPLVGAAVGRHRRWILPTIAVLLFAYASRAASGVVTGVAFARAALLDADGAKEKAGPFLEIAARGGDLRARRELAETRIAWWDDRVDRDGYEAVGTSALFRSARDYAVCACRSPAGWRPFEGLARVYHRLELARRAERSDTLGYEGAVAIGMQKMAIDRAPNWYLPRDRLAEMLRAYGLETPSLDAVRDSAALLPLFPRRLYPDDGSLSPAVAAAFAEGARTGLSRSRELDRAMYWISLGRVELARGENEAAIGALSTVFERRHDAAQRAETDLLLGAANRALGRTEEARRHFDAAREYAPLAAPALTELAHMAREAGETEDELAILTRLQPLRPDDPVVYLEIGAAAERLRQWTRAQNAFRRAGRLAPHDPRPAIALVECYLAQGDVEHARSELREAQAGFGDDPDLERLRDRIASGRAGS